MRELNESRRAELSMLSRVDEDRSHLFPIPPVCSSVCQTDRTHITFDSFQQKRYHSSKPVFRPEINMKPHSTTTHFSSVIEKRTRRARTRVSLNATADYDAKVHACYGDGLARRRSMDA